MNPFEVIFDAFKPFLDNEKPPVNVVEAGNLWAYFAGGMSTLRNEQLAYNILEDEELKKTGLRMLPKTFISRYCRN
jgi:hypothetical protein